MPKASAGLLMYRCREGELEVLLVHPGGPYWANKDLHAWSIPKGEFSDEQPLAAAVREFEEETGVVPTGDFLTLAPVKQSGGKVIYAFAIAGDCDPLTIRSNTFAMEWPPRSGRQQEFPEVDRAAWFPLDEAHEKIHKGQRPLLDQFRQMLKPS
jgi:predicted NUDIX family NTP pyrophosphohydrolase